MTSPALPDLSPMLATAGPLPDPDEQWAREVKWDGVRLLVAITASGLTARTRNGNEVSASYPELQALVDQVAGRPMLLDAEVVVFDKAGRSDFSLIQTRMHVRRPAATLVAVTPVQLMIFDLLYLDDQPLLRATYDDRREHLAGLRLNGPNWQTPAAVEGDGATILAASREHGLEGIMSKRRTSTYDPGGRSRSWVKTNSMGVTFTEDGEPAGQGRFHVHATCRRRRGQRLSGARARHLAPVTAIYSDQFADLTCRCQDMRSLRPQRTA